MVNTRHSEGDTVFSYLKQFNMDAILAKPNAVFPELPIYAKIKDLNKGNKDSWDDYEEVRPKPAIEVGLKFTF